MCQYLLILGIVCLFPFSRATACDVCGCAASNGLSGLLAGSERSYIGIRSLYRSFESRHIPSILGNEIPVEKSEELLSTYSLTGRFRVTEKVLLTFRLPYHHFYQKKVSKRIINEGLGDATLRTLFSMLGSKSGERFMNHRVWLVAGLKAPTGVFDLNGSISAPNLQLGTGAWDWMLGTAYSTRKNKLGTLVQLEYTFRGKSPQEYQYGNLLQGKAQAFHRIQANQRGLISSLGLSWQHIGLDRKEGVSQKYSGGTWLGGSLGARFYWNQLSLSLEAELPLYQSLSEKLVSNNFRLGFDLAFLFNSVNQQS